MQQLRTSTSPLAYARSSRPRVAQGAGDFWAGKEVLLHSDLVFRHDSMTGSYEWVSKLSPMPLPLLNGVYARLRAWFVPMTALQRFPSVEAYIASYNGEPEREGMDVVPHDVTVNSSGYFVGTPPKASVWHAAGYYAPQGQPVNRDIIEAYNHVINYERKNLAQHLPMKGLTTSPLAQATWIHTQFRDAKLTFDAARIHGEVQVQADLGRIPVSGLGLRPAASVNATAGATANADNWTGGEVPSHMVSPHEGSVSNLWLAHKDDFIDVYADLQSLDMKIKLGEIDQARVIARLADIRDKYAGHQSERLITDLMRGFSVPPAALQQPLLLAEQLTTYAQIERLATDGPNLDAKQVDTQAEVNLRYVVPETAVGGYVLITATVQPEQMFFGSFDPGVHLLPLDERPDALQDSLDLYKVRPMPNKYVKVDHPSPDGVYGFVPMNHHTTLPVRRLGGRYRDILKEDRAAIWSVQYDNPSLNEDGYLCPEDFPVDVFSDLEAENVTFMFRAAAVASGITQFGVPVTEETGSYEAIMDERPQA